MKKIFAILAALVVIVIAGLAIAAMTFDVNSYKPQIIEVLNKQTGRAVKLDGPIKLGFSSMGVSLSVENAAISNPPWASRPEMAGIGKFQLGVALMPLLDKRLVVTGIKVENADIQLETLGDKHNWDMQPADGAAPASPSTKGAVTQKSSDQSVAIKVSDIAVKNSQLTMRDAAGKVTVFKVDSLTLGAESGGIGIHFKGEYDNAPIALNVKTGADDLMTARSWPLDADLTYANLELKAKGKADLDAKKAALDSYSIKAGASDIHGQLTAAWGGAHPSVIGTLLSDKIDPNDFKGEGAADRAKPSETPAASGNPQRIFSDAPLPFDALKSADASLDVQIGEVVLKNNSLKQIAGKLTLANGALNLPLKASFGSANMTMNIGVNGAAAPAQVNIALNAPGVDIADLLKTLNAPAFMSGKGDAVMNIAASGNSMHALAGSADGAISVIAGKGEISTSAAGDLSSGLAQLLTGGNNSDLSLNCMAARFVATNGVVKDNGILVDTTASTMIGQGGFNLGAETINLLLTANAKVGKVSGVLPPLRVTGTFFKPSFMIDPSAILQDVAGILSGGSINGNVPDMQTQAGQNACVYTLDHPKASTASISPGNVLKSLTGDGQKINDIGNKMLKGLFGK